MVEISTSYSELLDGFPFGSSFLFNQHDSFVKPVQEEQGNENRFKVLIPVSVGEQ